MQFANDIVDAAKNMLLSVMFHNGTKSANWYAGLIDNNGFTGLNSADLMNSHAGWSEISSDIINELARVQWQNDAPANKIISNTTLMEYSFKDSGAIRGVFIADDSTLGGTTGNLWSTALFSSVLNVISGDFLRLVYTVTVA